jgi:hypothetical protein
MLGVGALIVVGLLVIAAAGLALSGAGGGRGLWVRVSVDDLAIGHLPPVCVKTGRRSDHLVPVEGSEAGFQPWWLLLLLLGPVGILAIVVLWATSSRPSRVGGHVPVSAVALGAAEAATRLSRTAFVTSLVGLVAGIALLVGPGVGVAVPAPAAGVAGVVVVVSLAVGVVAASVARRRWVDVRLDGSGRWALLGDVHPSFAAAVREQYASGHLTERG